MPTHGGGKRFDEEQRLVSATAQHAAERMSFGDMSKSKVALEVTSVNTSGSLFDPFWGGPNKEGGTGLPYFSGLHKLFGYRINPWIESQSILTSQDLVFLERSIEARLRYANYQVVAPEEADLYVIVLVDCYGTNQDRKDFALFFKDQLEVSCGLTWYVIDAHTQKLETAATSVMSQAVYEEYNLRFTTLGFHGRALHEVATDPLVCPQPRDIAQGEWGSAPVEQLQWKPPAFLMKGGTGGSKSRGANGGSTYTGQLDDLMPLPDGVPGDVSPDLLPAPDGEPPADLIPEILPPPDAAVPNPGAGEQLPMGELIRSGWAAAKAKDADKLHAVINEIRTRKPDSPAIEKLEERLRAIQQDNP